MPEESTLRSEHFLVTSGLTTPTPAAIAARLEQTWHRFRDLLGVEPGPVTVTLVATPAGATTAATASTQATATSTATVATTHGGQAVDAGVRQRAIAWSATDGEDLEGQRFSDLLHEIAHMYLLDVTGDTGVHHAHAWLHEAVACHHEGACSIESRMAWIRAHVAERIPLPDLFTMPNPVKEGGLVGLTVELHGKLARGEMTVEAVNRRIAGYAAAHAEEIQHAGVSHMTYYAEALSVLRFLLASEGNDFVRRMVTRLGAGETMATILADTPGYPEGIASLESRWLRWVEGGAVGAAPGRGDPF